MTASPAASWRRLKRNRRGSIVTEYGVATAAMVVGMLGAAKGIETFIAGTVQERSAEAQLVDGYEYPLDGHDFSERSINPSGNGQDQGGTYVLHDQNRTIELPGNAWKATVFDYTIGPDTLLTFNFRADVAGEIHAIGFQRSTEDFSVTTFKIHGSESYGITAYDGSYTVGEGLRHYEIPVGQHFTGDVNKLIFVMDDDAGVGANSIFSNIQVRY